MLSLNIFQLNNVIIFIKTYNLDKEAECFRVIAFTRSFLKIHDSSIVFMRCINTFLPWLKIKDFQNRGFFKTTAIKSLNKKMLIY